MKLCKGSDGLWTFEVLARFEEHRSMNYGSDVLPTNGKLKSIVSTSFYDKRLCLWHIDVDGLSRGRGRK